MKTLTEDMGYSQAEIDAKYGEFKSGLDKIDDDYVGYVSRTAEFKKEDNKRQISAMNKFYQYQIFASCVSAFQDGISLDSLASAGGTFLGAYLCSSNFRTMVKDYRGAINAKRMQKKLDKLDHWAEKYKRDLPANKQKAHDVLVAKLNGGRVPLTPKSTALTHLGFAKKAYADMRKPGANIDEIEATYSQAVKDLYETAQKDGCNMKYAAKNFRLAVGVCGEKDPLVYAMFDETCFGGFRPAVRSEYGNRMGKGGVEKTETRVFDGDFKNEEGKPCKEIFHIRRPADLESHLSGFTTRIMQAFAECNGQGDAFADKYNSLCMQSPVFRAALQDDISDKDAVRLQGDRLTRLREDTLQDILDGMSPDAMQKRMDLDREYKEKLAKLNLESEEFNKAFVGRFGELHPGMTVEEGRLDAAKFSFDTKLKRPVPDDYGVANPNDASSPEDKDQMSLAMGGAEYKEFIEDRQANSPDAPEDEFHKELEEYNVKVRKSVEEKNIDAVREEGTERRKYRNQQRKRDMIPYIASRAAELAKQTPTKADDRQAAKLRFDREPADHVVYDDGIPADKENVDDNLGLPSWMDKYM